MFQYREKAIESDNGEFNGSCNRRACQAPGATWYNKGTDKYYCHSCAVAINRACPPNNLLCTEDVRVYAKDFKKKC